MWSNDECNTLISTVEIEVLKAHPVTSTNNNHDFTGNLLDIIDNWSDVARKLKRTGEFAVTNRSFFAIFALIALFIIRFF